MKRWHHRQPAPMAATVEAPPAPERRGDGVLLDEVDAFLRGSYADLAVRSGEAVPGWAWLNAISHATIGELEATARRRWRASLNPDIDAWDHVVAGLAHTVLSTVEGDEDDLLDLQLEMLVPAELAMAEEWSQPVTSPQLEALVRTLLVTWKQRTPRRGR